MTNGGQVVTASLRQVNRHWPPGWRSSTAPPGRGRRLLCHRAIQLLPGIKNAARARDDTGHRSARRNMKLSSWFSPRTRGCLAPPEPTWTLHSKQIPSDGWVGNITAGALQILTNSLDNLIGWGCRKRVIYYPGTRSSSLSGNREYTPLFSVTGNTQAAGAGAAQRGSAGLHPVVGACPRQEMKVLYLLASYCISNAGP